MVDGDKILLAGDLFAMGETPAGVATPTKPLGIRVEKSSSSQHYCRVPDLGGTVILNSTGLSAEMLYTFPGQWQAKVNYRSVSMFSKKCRRRLRFSRGSGRHVGAGAPCRTQPLDRLPALAGRTGNGSGRPARLFGMNPSQVGEIDMFEKGSSLTSAHPVFRPALRRGP